MKHLVFSFSQRSLKVFDEDGELTLDVEARNDTVGAELYGEDFYGHDGRCPQGDYTIEAPSPNDPPTIAEGAYFIPIDDPHGLWTALGRSEIGIHGGGSASPTPLAPMQGWYPTEGCIRLQNRDLATLVAMVEAGDRLTVGP